jgi:hypothetical protein
MIECKRVGILLLYRVQELQSIETWHRYIKQDSIVHVSLMVQLVYGVYAIDGCVYLIDFISQ